MKRMKKLFAILMTMAMVMGLGITGFAATTATITINGLATDGTNTVTCYKILEPNIDVAIGYEYAENVSLTNYPTASDFLAETNYEDQQTALVNADKSEWEVVSGTLSDDGTTFTINGAEAGYYAVFITNDENIVYTSPMLIGVEYNTATYNPANDTYTYNLKQESITATAKYTDIPVTKDATSSDEADDVTELGRTVEYTITTYIPSEAEKFILTDTLTGAEYNQNSVVITVGGESISTEGIVDFTTTSGSMIITLTSQLSDNAGKKVVITYDATVTDDYVNNKVVPNDGKHNYDEDIETTLKTGAISLLKKGVDEEADALNGAKFVVYKTTSDGNVYLKKTEANRKVSYTWGTKAEATRFETGVDGAAEDDGKIVIEGLDMGTYYFEEVEAPSGYSINTETPSVLIDEDNLTSNAEISATPAGTEMTDTKLSALPSTGGMGTTLFTIAGCVIMISAAGLFFATRKKAN